MNLRKIIREELNSFDWLKSIGDDPEQFGNLTLDDLEDGNTYIYKINWDIINNEFGGMNPSLWWLEDFNNKEFKVIDISNSGGYTILMDGKYYQYSGNMNFFRFAKFIKK